MLKNVFILFIYNLKPNLWFDRKSRRFTFDCCFDSTNQDGGNFADQEVVFDNLGTDILDNAFKGQLY